MSMMDPAMQQAMMGMVGGGPGGGDPMAGGMVGDPMAAAGPMSDQELLMLVLQLIASGQLSGPGVQVLAEATGGAGAQVDPMADPMAGGMDPMAGGDPMGGMGPMPGQSSMF
jgi:hypothetical protein